MSPGKSKNMLVKPVSPEFSLNLISEKKIPFKQIYLDAIYWYINDRGRTTLRKKI